MAIRRRQQRRLTPIAAALLAAGPSLALAQSAATLPEVRVTAPGEGSYRAETVESPKATAPLVDTPQTVTVIPAQVIRERNAYTLTDVLRQTPGLSFNAGENGFGTTTNSFSLRGFDTTGSVFVDGARDSGNFTRDAFNLEQVEVVKGPAADNGRGGAGGYVNLVTKTPKLGQNFMSGTLGFGFDGTDASSRRRGSADLNASLGDSAAFRINLMAENGGMSGREHARQKGVGLAPSLALRLGSSTDLVLAYQYLQHDDRPDWGVPAAMISGMLNHDPAIGKDHRDRFYGLLSDRDRVRSESMLARIEHRFSPNVSISNQTRWSTADREALYTVPSGYAAATQRVTTQMQAYGRDNESITNLTNLSIKTTTGSLRHNIALGLELSREKSTAGRYGTNEPVNPGQVSVFSPDPARASARFSQLTPTQTAKVDIETVAVYAYDTVELNPNWELTGGLRLERYKVGLDSRTAAGAPQGPDGFSRSETSIGGKIGVVYKPVRDGSLYAAYGQSSQPPGSYLSTPDISRTGDNAFPGWQGQNHADSKEQRNANVELGVKWDLFDRRLSTAASLFHSERKNIAMGPGIEPVGYGKQQVQGIELSAAGALTSRWSVFGGLLYMKSKRTHSAAIDAALSGDYAGATTTSGDELAFTPKVSATLWTTYRLGGGVTFGGGLQHVGSSWVGRPDTADRVIPNGRFGKLPSYTVANLMASYDVNRNLALRLNVDNVGDKLYALSSNWPGTRVHLGAPRTVMLSADVRF